MFHFYEHPIGNVPVAWNQKQWRFGKKIASNFSQGHEVPLESKNLIENKYENSGKMQN